MNIRDQRINSLINGEKENKIELSDSPFSLK